MLPFAKFRRKKRLFQRKKLTYIQALTSAKIHAKSHNWHSRYLFLKNALKLSLLGESNPNGMFQKLRHRVFGCKTQPDQICCIFLAVSDGEHSRFRMEPHNETGTLLAILDCPQEPFDGWTACGAKGQPNVEKSRIQDATKSAQIDGRNDGDCINLQSVHSEFACKGCLQHWRSVTCT